MLEFESKNRKLNYYNHQHKNMNNLIDQSGVNVFWFLKKDVKYWKPTIVFSHKWQDLSWRE